MKRAQDDFHDDCTEWLSIRAKGKWERYGLDILLRTVLDVFRFEKLPLERQTARVGKLISVKDQEIARIKRIDSWNEKTNRANSEDAD